MTADEPRRRLRELGLSVGSLPPGPLNAITDVPGVRVGQVTLIQDRPAVVRTGVTAIVPFEGEMWERHGFAGFHSFNGFGEMGGAHWVAESGLLTSPIVLTATYSMGVARDALLAYPELAGHPQRIHQPIVGETNDGVLSDGVAGHITAGHVIAALAGATGGPVPEGNVGGGTGMICHEFKGGTGTASRAVRAAGGGFTVGVLVQANYGKRADLRLDGIAVGRAIGHAEVPPPPRLGRPGGSIVIVVATDAPLLAVQCQRLARRAVLGLGRVGGMGANQSGDLIMAFSTGNALDPDADSVHRAIAMVPHHHLDEIFAGAVEATEEAILNALTAAQTMRGRNGAVAHALPLGRLVAVAGRLAGAQG
jgi:D-aminopeptidase